MPSVKVTATNPVGETAGILAAVSIGGGGAGVTAGVGVEGGGAAPDGRLGAEGAVAALGGAALGLRIASMTISGTWPCDRRITSEADRLKAVFEWGIWL